MKKLQTTWEGVADPTGYLFSFAKALSCAVKNSPWPQYAEDIIATSGFAFRMWVSPDLCPSATSMWAFSQQPFWVGNGGFVCHYTERLWGQDGIKEEKRIEAIEQAKKAIDAGIPAISWDIGVPEWGLLIGYDDRAQRFATLSVSGEGEMPFSQLGERDIPILSVLTLVNRTDKSPDDILVDTIKLAASHLRGEEWCDNAKGLEAYPALTKHFEEAFNPDTSWNMEYLLGTYGALKYYAWRYFDNMGHPGLCGLYRAVYEAWLAAFNLKTGQDIGRAEVRAEIAALLKTAEKHEKRALEIMEKDE